MKNKLEQRRQEVIARILRGYGSIDRVDTLCLGVRFKVAPEVITQDVANVSEALKREVVAQERAAQLAQERTAELALVQKILRSGEA